MYHFARGLSQTARVASVNIRLQVSQVETLSLKTAVVAFETSRSELSSRKARDDGLEREYRENVDREKTNDEERNKDDRGYEERRKVELGKEEPG